MLPNKLKRHLSSAHPSLVEKPKKYFLRKLENLTNQKASISSFSHTGQNVVMASYKVAYRVARCKKPHTIAEELILPAATDLVGIMIGDNAAKKLKDVPLSNNTICRRIEDMGVDITDQLICRLKDNEFAIQLDEATFGGDDAYLICYVRYLFQAEKRIVEDLLFCKPIELRCRGVDMFHIIDDFFSENGLQWQNVVGICTDGARSMSGKYNGLQSLIRECAPLAKWTHCMLHREALASQCFRIELNEVVEEIVKVINYVKTSAVRSRIFSKLCDDLETPHKQLLFHATTRWLSLGNAFARVFELRQELLTFLQLEKHRIAESFQQADFLLKFSYLCDIFEKLNKLNVSMQGNDANILELSDKIEAFVRKISLWRFDVSNNSGHEYFPFLNRMLADLSVISLPLVVSNTASEHLSALEANFKQYFTSDFSSYVWIRNPFSVSVVPSMFYGSQKEEFIDLSCNNTLKSKMDQFCTDFWIEACTEYPVISKAALRLLIPFATSYMCETGFSAVAVIKTKYRSKLDVEREMRVAVSNITPRFEALCQSKRANVSH